MVQLRGQMSFGAGNGMARRLDDAGEYDVLLLDLTRVPFVNTSVAIALEGVIKRGHSHRKKVTLVGLRGPVARILAKLGIFQQLGPGGRFRSRARALAYSASLLADAGTHTV